MSTHAVRVVKIEDIRPHTNADALEITHVNGWQCIIPKGAYAPGDLAIFVEPDYVVPTSLPEFSFLSNKGFMVRIRATRLRGEMSYGLLVSAKRMLDLGYASKAGDDVMEALEITRYEPPVHGRGSADDLPFSEWPKHQLANTKFDLENVQNNLDKLSEGEPIVVTEKIHGANARYLFQDGKFYIGTRARWLKPDGASWWHRAVTPQLEKLCQDHPGTIFYGEVYGSVQSLKYGTKQGEVKFALFASNWNGLWDHTGSLFETAEQYGVEHVPILYIGPYSLETCMAFAEMDSHASSKPGDIMEGVVITPERERMDPTVGRVSFKYISSRYWMSGK